MISSKCSRFYRAVFASSGAVLGLLPLLIAGEAQAGTFKLTIDGGASIFLAGRNDLSVPSASEPWDVLSRHGGATPEEIQETLPPFLSIKGGDVIKVADPAVGGISFYNGYGGWIFGPGGNGSDGSALNSLGGISGYVGPQGPLVGIFLDDLVPNGSSAPEALNFSSSGLGTDFSSLAPSLGQVFYIGDGLMSSGQFQEFIAPSEATRLFLGIPDGFGFWGQPGAYDDNDGSYQVLVGVNASPTEPESKSTPEPGSLFGLLSMSFLLPCVGRFSRKKPARKAS